MAESAEDVAPGDGLGPAEDGWIGRTLLRAARSGTLATVADGAPYAALVTPALLASGAPVLLLSALSTHTHQLEAEPRCALLVTGAQAGLNPQTTPRLTLQARAVRDGDPATRARYLAVHPYAALYADFTDFAFWRLDGLSGHFIGGFARAAWIAADALRPDPAAVAAIAAAEAGIIGHCNADHAEALAVIAGRAGGPAGEWRMVTVDPDGCDLAAGEQVIRIAWQAPVADPSGVRRELVRLAKR